MNNELGKKAIEELRISYHRDSIIMSIAMVLAVIFCGYQYHIKQFGTAFIFATIGFIDGMLLVAYTSIYKNTRRLFEEGEKLVDEIMKEVEEKDVI